MYSASVSVFVVCVKLFLHRGLLLEQRTLIFRPRVRMQCCENCKCERALTMFDCRAVAAEGRQLKERALDELSGFSSFLWRL